VAGRCALVGNVNNPKTLFRGSLEMVREEVRKACDANVGLIGAECAVPLVSQTKLLMEIPKATKEYRESVR
jgi:[methyl-Co(III) methanol-specific corrinoid protein]:coenzyme M methyltransferase